MIAVKVGINRAAVASFLVLYPIKMLFIFEVTL